MTREKHVVSSLIERRARLPDELRAMEIEIKRMKRALASIDLCILMFKEDFDPKTMPPKVWQKPSRPRQG